MGVANEEKFFAGHLVAERCVFQFELEGIHGDAKNIGVKNHPDIRHLHDELSFYVIIKNSVAVENYGKDGAQDDEYREQGGRKQGVPAREVTTPSSSGNLAVVLRRPTSVFFP